MKRLGLLLLVFIAGCVDPETGYVKVILDDRTESVKVVDASTYYNPIHQDVYVYSTDPLDAVWGIDGEEDKRFGFTTKEGAKLSGAVSLTFRVPAEEVSALVGRHKRSQKRFIRTRIHSSAHWALIKEALQTETANFFGPARLEFQNRVANRLRDNLFHDEGILLQEFRLTEVWFPEEIRDMVKSRIHAEQEARKAEAQIARKRAEADQATVVLESEMAAARKWAEINQELSKSITPELLQYLVLRNERVLNQECPVFP